MKYKIIIKNSQVSLFGINDMSTVSDFKIGDGDALIVYVGSDEGVTYAKRICPNSTTEVIFDAKDLQFKTSRSVSEEPFQTKFNEMIILYSSIGIGDPKIIRAN